MNRQGSGRNRQSMRRVVIKQGYLKKLPNSAKFGSSMKKPERRWFVFGVMNFQDPYLEYYEDEDALFQNNPINIIFLENIIRVIKDQKNQRYQNVFTLVMQDRQLSLVAQTREQMHEWSRSFEAQFRELGLLNINLEGENDYVDIPKVTRPNRASRTNSGQEMTRDPLVSLALEEENTSNAIAEENAKLASSTSLTNTDRSLPVSRNVDVTRVNVNGRESDETGDNSLYCNVGQGLNNQNSSSSARNSHLLRRNRPSELKLQNPNTVEPVVAESQANSINVDIGSNGLDKSVSSHDENHQTAGSTGNSGHQTGSSGEGDEYENLWERNNAENDYAIPSRLSLLNSNKNNRTAGNNINGSNLSSSVNNNYSPLRRRTDASAGGSAAAGAADNEPLIDIEQEHDEVDEIAMQVARGSNNKASSYHRLESTDSSNSDLGSPIRSVHPPEYTPTQSPARMPAAPTTPNNYSFFPQNDPLATPPRTPLTPSTPLSPYPGVYLASPFASPPNSPSVLPDKMREALGLNGNSNTGDAVGSDQVSGWSVAPPVADDAPPPYMPRGVLERGANKSLKVSQVEELLKQQHNPGGVKVILKKIDCHRTLAFVDCFGSIWIAGWNQTARPFLQTAFHIGDQLISINGQVIESSRMACKLIKHCSEMDKITFVIKRVPHARIFTFKRLISGEMLGFTREGGTGEITSVNPSGIASVQGMPTKSQTLGADNFCNWYITEINNRPLSLLYKDKEIEHRLKAVGLDISITIQPCELIKEFKKQLKAMKYYKDYIVQ